MVENVSRAFTGEVEITVLAQVEDGGLVGGGFVIDDQFVCFGERVTDSDFQIAREPFFAVLAEVGECDPSLAFEWSALPHSLIKSLDAAMQGIWTVILRQRILHAVEGE